MACVVVGAGCPTTPDFKTQMKCNWTQWGQDPTHSGNVCTRGQLPKTLLARVPFDPFAQIASDEAREPGADVGELLVHYPVPLIVDDDVYVLAKAGSWTPCDPVGSFLQADGGSLCGLAARDSQSWGIQRLHWEGGHLLHKWTYLSDWKPPPYSLTDWEPAFQGAVVGDFVYLPGANGALHVINRIDGT